MEAVARAKSGMISGISSGGGGGGSSSFVPVPTEMFTGANTVSSSFLGNLKVLYHIPYTILNCAPRPVMSFTIK